MILYTFDCICYIYIQIRFRESSLTRCASSFIHSWIAPSIFFLSKHIEVNGNDGVYRMEKENQQTAFKVDLICCLVVSVKIHIPLQRISHIFFWVPAHWNLVLFTVDFSVGLLAHLDKLVLRGVEILQGQSERDNIAMWSLVLERYVQIKGGPCQSLPSEVPGPSVSDFPSHPSTFCGATQEPTICLPISFHKACEAWPSKPLWLWDP